MKKMLLLIVASMLIFSLLYCEKNITNPGSDFSNFTIKPLTETNCRDQYPSWARDSKKIVFNRSGAICILDVATSEEKTYQVEMDGSSTPTFSHDLQSIYYEKLGNLFKLDINSGNSEHINLDHFPVFFPCSSDAPEIIYFTWRDKIIEYNMAQHTSSEYQGQYVHQLLPRISFASNRLCFLSYSPSQNQVSLISFQDGALISALDTGDSFYDDFVQFVSDGKIALTSQASDSGRKIVLLRSKNGSISQEITGGESFDRQAAMSPDKNKIVFSRRAKSDVGSPIFVAYDRAPEPIGGFEALQNKLVYPDSAIKNGIEGRVYVYARVFINGVVDSTKILKSLGYGCDEVAMQVVESAYWMPAYQRNTPVSVWVGIPIVFRLNNLSKPSISMNAENLVEQNDEQDNLYLVEFK